MSVFAAIAGFAAGLAGMEAVAWAMHRYVMHGPLWVLHRSHHEPARGWFELNDLFAFFFAGVAVGLFVLGAEPGWRPLWWAGAGSTVYGLLYALAHDGFAHARWPMPSYARNPYLKRMVQAHRIHHAVATREGGVSFGFLMPADPRRLSATLRARRAA